MKVEGRGSHRDTRLTPWQWEKGNGDNKKTWVATSQLPGTAGHPFYEGLNRLLDEHGFDDFVEGLCAKFYADEMGRPSLAPGVYFRLLLVGYFEGIGSERGIAWRAADSLALRKFLGLKVIESPPDHSTISRTRRLLDVAIQEAVFAWVLKRIGASGLLRGKTIGIDATTLEANAALRSIVRRDSEQGYEEFLMELAKASGIETPRREDLARLDRKRTGKGSNRQWKHPHDPDARISRMKDGQTHLAHKAEHAVDLEAVGLRSYVSEPRRGKRRWRGDRQGQKAVYANRRRIRGVRGQRLLRQRGERLERPCAHLYGSGGMRRLHVRRHENVLKRLLIQVSAFNLGMLMRQHLGVGTPRGLQGRICALMLLILSLFKRLKGLFGLIPVARPKNPTQRPLCCFHRWILPELRKPASTTAGRFAVSLKNSSQELGCP